MDGTPVTFEMEGKEYNGILSRVMGAGSSEVYHLSVNNYHFGSLHYIQKHPGLDGGRYAHDPEWRFDSNTFPQLGALADYFAELLYSSGRDTM